MDSFLKIIESKVTIASDTLINHDVHLEKCLCICMFRRMFSLFMCVKKNVHVVRYPDAAMQVLGIIKTYETQNTYCRIKVGIAVGSQTFPIY